MEEGLPSPYSQGPPQKNRGFFGKLAQGVSNHPGVSLAIIIVLLIAIIVLFVMWKGYFGFGGKAKGKGRPLSRKRGRQGSTGEDKEPQNKQNEEYDPEAESLIDTINGRQGLQ